MHFISYLLLYNKSSSNSGLTTVIIYLSWFLWVRSLGTAWLGGPGLGLHDVAGNQQVLQSSAVVYVVRISTFQSASLMWLASQCWLLAGRFISCLPGFLGFLMVWQLAFPKTSNPRDQEGAAVLLWPRLGSHTSLLNLCSTGYTGPTLVCWAKWQHTSI